MLSLIATLEHENARLADENARLKRPAPQPPPPEPVETTHVREPARRRSDDDAGVFAVMFALYVVLKIFAVLMSV